MLNDSVRGRQLIESLSPLPGTSPPIDTDNGARVEPGCRIGVWLSDGESLVLVDSWGKDRPSSLWSFDALVRRERTGCCMCKNLVYCTTIASDAFWVSGSVFIERLATRGRRPTLRGRRRNAALKSSTSSSATPSGRRNNSERIKLRTETTTVYGTGSRTLQGLRSSDDSPLGLDMAEYGRDGVSSEASVTYASQFSDKEVADFNRDLSLRTICVEGLDDKVAEDELREYFQDFGTVVETSIERGAGAIWAGGAGVVTFFEKRSVDALLSSDADHSETHMLQGTKATLRRMNESRPETQAEPFTLDVAVGGSLTLKQVECYFVQQTGDSVSVLQFRSQNTKEYEKESHGLSFIVQFSGRDPEFVESILALGRSQEIDGETVRVQRHLREEESNPRPKDFANLENRNDGAGDAQLYRASESGMGKEALMSTPAESKVKKRRSKLKAKPGKSWLISSLASSTLDYVGMQSGRIPEWEREREKES